MCANVMMCQIVLFLYEFQQEGQKSRYLQKSTNRSLPIDQPRRSHLYNHDYTNLLPSLPGTEQLHESLILCRDQHRSAGHSLINEVLVLLPKHQLRYRIPCLPLRADFPRPWRHNDFASPQHRFSRKVETRQGGEVHGQSSIWTAPLAKPHKAALDGSNSLQKWPRVQISWFIHGEGSSRQFPHLLPCILQPLYSDKDVGSCS